jgi:tRNA 2-thiouridine synthesizing protein A
MIQDAQELDARGLNCPLPALIAKKSLTGMMSAQVLEVFVETDPQRASLVCDDWQRRVHFS